VRKRRLSLSPQAGHSGALEATQPISFFLLLCLLWLLVELAFLGFLGLFRLRWIVSGERSFFSAGAQLAAHTQPAPRTGPIGPCLMPAQCIPESNS